MIADLAKSTPTITARATAHRIQHQLLTWLIEDAAPLWFTCGFDWLRGGFYERLAGMQALDEPRRARVQPRQVFAVATAAELGWNGDARTLVSRGLECFIARYRRPDGLFRTLAAADGRVIDDRVFLYDQAFALLGLAKGHDVPGACSHAQATAGRLLSTLYGSLKRTGAGFESGLLPGNSLSANAHMHLFEAALAWQERSDDPRWTALCDELGELALSHLIDRTSGVVHENFVSDWSPMPGMAGHLIEPGHHFEWAWLLFQWADSESSGAWRAALRLIDIGEQQGVRDGVAISVMLDDYSVIDGSARLWAQAERLRTAAFVARITGDERYWKMAISAAAILLLYLQRKVPGSWYDRLTPEGCFVEEPAPASSFYHIVGAIKELTAAIRAQ